MLLDTQLQTLSGWETHIQTDGSQIGGVPPLKYGMISGIPGQPNARLFYIDGSTVPNGYADWEAYISRPVLPNTGNFELSFTLMVDENASQYAQAIETDTILSIGGWNYNLSLQLNYAEGGKIQIANVLGGWVDTGICPGKLTPHVPHEYRIAYNFDTVKRVSAVTSFTLDGQVYPIALKPIPATNAKWKDGAIFQVQQDLTAAAGKFSMTIDNAQYAWW